MICGGSPEATAEACDAFIAEFLSSDINGELILAGDTYICKKDAYNGCVKSMRIMDAYNGFV